ncbi:MAG TPA: thioesterase family protein [Thermoanaerobaculia bacterium]|jgi:YbgC/YbaW family acyl-CoA thioester hydrolase|nr:thioesterase family protein [Thermoanaerobaculia bacterium]
MHEHRVRRKVEYVDTDMSGIVHFSRFLIYMENTEHAFLKAIGADVHIRDGEGREISWPRVSVSCDYQSPARFGDELEIHLRVIRKGTRSLTYGFEISRGGETLAKGRSTCACCVINDPGGIKAIPIPAEIAQRIEEAHHREGE